MVLKKYYKLYCLYKKATIFLKNPLTIIKGEYIL